MKRCTAVVGMVALGAAAGITALLTIPRQRLRPSVLLVTIDTLRADSLGCYGGPPRLTPHLDRLAAEGMQFVNAASPLPLTRPAHFTLMTSRYPRNHGVVNNSLNLAPMATVPEAFRRAGYRTGAFVATKLLGPGSGAEQGFDTFSAPTEEQTTRGEEVASLAVRWLESHTSAQPFFLWLHLFDPHMPYDPPAAHRPPSAGDLAELLPAVSWPRLLDLAARTKGHLPAAVLGRAKDLYAGEVAYTDQVVGGVLAAVDRHDSPMIVAVTADHGECFDHGIFFEHADCLYDGAIRVPLLLRYPPRIAPGTRPDRQVELLDVAPTLLDLAGLPIPPEFNGRSLMAARGRGAAFIQGPAYSPEALQNRSRRLAQLHSVAGETVRPLPATEIQVGVRTDSWKYLALGDQEELYALGHDPGERRSLAAVESEAVRSLRIFVSRWLTAHPPRASPQDVSPELRETLRALGYVQ